MKPTGSRGSAEVHGRRKITMTTAKKTSLSGPVAMMPIYENLVKLTDGFCEQHLNAEYAEPCRQMAAALCRKRPSPLGTSLASNAL